MHITRRIEATGLSPKRVFRTVTELEGKVLHSQQRWISGMRIAVRVGTEATTAVTIILFSSASGAGKQRRVHLLQVDLALVNGLSNS